MLLETGAGLIGVGAETPDCVRCAQPRWHRDQAGWFPVVGEVSYADMCTQALVDAAAGSPRDQAIRTATYACIFLGVPNRGLNTAQLAAMVKGQRNSQLISDLGIDSQRLPLLHEEFGAVFNYTDSLVISVFETRLSRSVQVTPPFPSLLLLLLPPAAHE